MAKRKRKVTEAELNVLLQQLEKELAETTPPAEEVEEELRRFRSNADAAKRRLKNVKRTK